MPFATIFIVYYGYLYRSFFIFITFPLFMLSFSLPWFISEHGYISLIVITPFVVMQFFSTIRTAFTDPGILPRNESAEANDTISIEPSNTLRAPLPLSSIKRESIPNDFIEEQPSTPLIVKLEDEDEDEDDNDNEKPIPETNQTVKSIIHLSVFSLNSLILFYY